MRLLETEGYIAAGGWHIWWPGVRTRVWHLTPLANEVLYPPVPPPKERPRRDRGRDQGDIRVPQPRTAPTTKSSTADAVVARDGGGDGG
jgi:hypothetical protein